MISEIAVNTLSLLFASALVSGMRLTGGASVALPLAACRKAAGSSLARGARKGRAPEHATPIRRML